MTRHADILTVLTTLYMCISSVCTRRRSSCILKMYVTMCQHVNHNCVNQGQPPTSFKLVLFRRQEVTGSLRLQCTCHCKLRAIYKATGRLYW